MTRWLRRSSRKAAPPDPKPPPPTGSSSPLPRTTGSSPPAAPLSACHGVRVVSSPARDALDVEAVMALARKQLAPPPLGELGDDVMLAVASVPGKMPEEWQPAYPLWMAWPHAAEAACAVEMTAAQLRARLAGMGGR